MEAARKSFEDREGDEPLQLLEFVRPRGSAKSTIELKRDTLNLILERVGNRHIAVICVCGPSRQGKSFILGYMIRCLNGLENDVDDWMDWKNLRRPLAGFKFRNGVSPETQGIWIWSRPFIVKGEDEKEIAILLIDTQGTYDEFTTTKDMSAIVGMSLLTSSVMIFNFFHNLQEDVLSALMTYTEYGKLALESTNDEDSRPFQKLYFLIRDWNNPSQYDYGGKGGREFLTNKLSVKEEHSPEARHVRETIQKCFQKLDCYLMPAIGERAKMTEFTGSISELDMKFAKNLEIFINQLVSPDNITVKRVMGNAVTAAELQKLLETYVTVFNSDDIPSAESMWQATYKITNSTAVEKSVTKYKDVLKKKQWGKNYLCPEDLEEAHSEAKEEALKVFKKAKKFGGADTISEYLVSLQQQISITKSSIESQNDEKRKNFIKTGMEESAGSFTRQLHAEFPLKGKTVFFEEDEIERFSEMIKMAVIAEIKEKLSNESKSEIKKLETELESKLTSISDALQNQSKVNRSTAEKQISTILNDVIAEHQQQANELYKKHQFDDSQILEGAYDKLKTSTFSKFNDMEKPGSVNFQKEYLFQLDRTMHTLFHETVNKVKLFQQEVALKTENILKSYCDEYETDLNEAADEEEMDEEIFDSIHFLKMPELLEKFGKEGNLYPKNIPKFRELQKRLESQLDQIFQQVNGKVIANMRHSEDTYKNASLHATSFHRNALKSLLGENSFFSAEELQEKHDKIYKEAMDEFDRFEKSKGLTNLEEIVSSMKSAMMENFQHYEAENDNRRKLAESKAELIVTECEAEYNQIMKTKMEHPNIDIDTCHSEAKQLAKEKLAATCPLKNSKDVDAYQRKLEEKIEEYYLELKDIFNLKMQEGEVTIKMILADGRKKYHDEMGKHFNNETFLHPDELKSLHERAKRAVMQTVEGKQKLDQFQRTLLESEFEALYKMYEKRNKMTLNTEAPAIGIDLGTTYCCVGVYYKGKLHIVPNQDQGGHLTTPSYVTIYPDGSETVGKPAKDNAHRNFENTIYDAKRIIGRKIGDEELHSDMKFWPFNIESHNGVPKIMIECENGPKYYHPEQISAKLLVSLRKMSEKFLKLPAGSINKAVITVPAYFNDGQRQATVDAGEIAGLEVLTILNEPTAAAIAYTLERLDSDPRNVLIYDLGGGTFDVAVLKMKPEDIDVLGVNGDTHLGGEDFDKKMMEYCAHSFKSATGVDLFNGKDSGKKQIRDEVKRTLRRLQTECEKAKRDLAVGRITTVEVDAMKNGKDLSVKVTREKFEELNQSYFETTIKLVEKTLKDVGLKKEEIEDIVLVGGSSRIPKVQEMLEKFFGGKALNNSIHPDHAVAYGAAVQAAIINGESSFKINMPRDVTPLPLGIEVSTKALSVIIGKNSKIPLKKSEDYCTAKDFQTEANIKIYQGEDLAVAARNYLLGEFILKGIPSKKAGEEKLDVWMEFDKMGILYVTAVCRSTQGTNSLVVEAKKMRMTREEIIKYKET